MQKAEDLTAANAEGWAGVQATTAQAGIGTDQPSCAPFVDGAFRAQSFQWLGNLGVLQRLPLMTALQYVQDMTLQQIGHEGCRTKHTQ